VGLVQNHAHPASDAAKRRFPTVLRNSGLLAFAAMHPDLILANLDTAERHIASNRKKITEQITFIAWLNWLRKDSTGAKALLREFEMRLAAHITDRERLRVQLAYVDSTASSREQKARHGLTETRILQLRTAV